jgi:flagellar hook-associated protein 3 FlgL
MRISTVQSFNTGIDALQRRQAELAESQERMTTLQRVNKASDDPAAAARSERALAGIVRSETSQRAVEASRTAMGQTEGAIAEASALMQDAREALVAAGNGSYSDTERRGVADRLAHIREQLFAVANRSDGAGSYLFGGQAATQPPFRDAPGGVQFVGTTGQAVTESTTALPLTADGAAIFLSARTGNGVFETRAGAGVTQARIDTGSVTDPAALTGSDYSLQFSVAAGVTTYAVLKDGAATAVTAAPYTAGKAITVDGMSVTVSGAPANGDSFEIAPSSADLNIFDVLDRSIQQLSTAGRTSAQVTQANDFGLRDIDAALGNVLSARSAAGQTLARIDTETARLADLKLAGQTERSKAEDLDMAEAISEFQTRQTGYDAALKSYSMVQRMSLFSYLNG